MDIKDFIKTDSDKAKQMFSESINPTRDWYIIVFFFVIFFLAMLLASYFIYDGVKKGDLFSGRESTGTSIESVKVEQLSKNVYHYEMRRIKFSEMKNISQVDPSL